MSRVAVVIPAYNSYGTLQRCVDALAQQSNQDFEAIIIDSTSNPPPLPETAPQIRIVQTKSRLLIHKARNRGAAELDSELIAFTDPDCCPNPDWLERMVAAYDRTGDAITGGIACWGNRWLDSGVHILKFDTWLPGGRTRWMPYGPTANLLIDRKTYEAVGLFDENVMLGDLLFSWKITQAGKRIRFLPKAVVQHDHEARGFEFLRERWNRGKEMATWRARRFCWGRRHRLAWAILSLLPVRLLGALLRMGRNAARAGMLRQFFVTLPITTSGTIVHLVAETTGYLDMWSVET